MPWMRPDPSREERHASLEETARMLSDDPPPERVNDASDRWWRWLVIDLPWLAAEMDRLLHKLMDEW